MNFVVHRNKWWWGDSVTFIDDNGLGEVEVQFDKSWIGTAYIRGLGVYETSRLRGLGRALLETALEEARQRGMKFAKLDVDRKIDWLVKWYERMGFIKSTENDNEFSMVKVL